MTYHNVAWNFLFYFIYVFLLYFLCDYGICLDDMMQTPNKQGPDSMPHLTSVCKVSCPDIFPPGLWKCHILFDWKYLVFKFVSQRLPRRKQYEIIVAFSPLLLKLPQVSVKNKHIHSMVHQWPLSLHWPNDKSSSVLVFCWNKIHGKKELMHCSE